MSVRFTAVQVEIMERVAASEGIALSALIRRAVSMYLFDVNAKRKETSVRGIEDPSADHPAVEGEVSEGEPV